MSSRSKLKKIIAMSAFLMSQPRLSFFRLSQMKDSLRGFIYSDHYSNSPEYTSSSFCVHEASSASTNPLKAFFDSRETGRGIWKWIHYFDIYDRHFSKFVGRDVHVLEIGIYSGGSLEMWRHYFGQNCRVYGVDIEEACKTYENEYTDIFIGDQEDRNFWKTFKERVPTIDILIDDGGHSAEQQIVTLEEMLPHLRPGGIYLCEDVHGVHNGFCSFSQGLVNNLNAMMFSDPELRHKGGISPIQFQAWIRSVHFYPYITVLEKTDSPVQKFITSKKGTEWQPFL